MLTLWTWGTVNGRKPIILLEELGLAYNIRPVDLTRKQQLEPEFRKLNPIGKIPVLVDEDDGPIIESNAILWYLGNKTGRLLGEGDRVSKVMQWLFFEAATAGPPLVNRWRLRHRLPEKPPSEVERHRGDSERALAMIEETLAESRYFAGAYSIADIAFVGLLKQELAEPEQEGNYPAIRAWLERCEARPSVQKGLACRIG